MTNTKCPHCGLDNWLTPAVCERCGAPLGGGSPEARAPAPVPLPTPEPARPDFPLITFGSDVMAGSTSWKPQEPPVWKWYVAYCAVMAIMYLVVVIMGVVFLAIPARLAMKPQEGLETQVWGLITIGLGILFLAPYAAAPFLPRRRWAWVVGIVLIGIGMTSMCCLPAAIPLLIFWLKPENKAFFDGGVEGRQGE